MYIIIISEISIKCENLDFYKLITIMIKRHLINKLAIKL